MGQLGIILGIKRNKEKEKEKEKENDGDSLIENILTQTW